MIECEANRFPEGERIYNAYCANCHMDDGSGLSKVYPPLENRETSLLKEISIACLIKKGLPSSSNNFRAAMPANEELSEIQVNNLSNYVITRFYKGKSFSINEIKEQLSNCSDLDH